MWKLNGRDKRIHSLDIISRIAELEKEVGYHIRWSFNDCTDVYGYKITNKINLWYELINLSALAGQCKTFTNWYSGCMLIRHDEFHRYVKDTYEGNFNVIDKLEEISSDYKHVMFDNRTYIILK